MKRREWALTGLMALLLHPAVNAADYPARPVKIIVPYAPGGTVDLAARIMGKALADKWGKAVVIDNKAGGNGFIGTNAAAGSTPDGYSLLFAHNGEFAVNPVLFKNIPYDLERDFIPISLVMETPLALVTSTRSGIDSLGDLLREAKARPRSVNYSTPGTGSYNNLAGEWFSTAAKLSMTHVPYKGGAPATAAVVSGEVQIGVLGVSVVAPFVKGGRLKVLAVLSEKRMPASPDWPAIGELGIHGVHAANWVGMFAPKKTPPDIVEQLVRDVQAAAASPEVTEMFSAIGASVLAQEPKAFRDRIARELILNKTIIEKSGIQAEE